MQIERFPDCGAASPSISVSEINSRQSLVAFFLRRPHLRADLSALLSDLEDCTRLVQKILLGRGFAADLSAISTSANIWNSIKQRFELEKKMEKQETGVLDKDEWASLDMLSSKLQSLEELARHIESALSRGGGADTFQGPDEEQTGEREIEPFLAISNAKSVTANFNWTVRPE